MKIVIAGGSGLVGQSLTSSLTSDGHQVIVLSRHPAAQAPVPRVRYVEWDAKTQAASGWAAELEGADGVVNLAGASVGSRRWTRRRMAELLASRLNATGALVDAMARVPPERRPPVFVSASGIDYYGNRGDELITEESPPGQSFLARMTEQWEAAAGRAAAAQVRVVCVRTAMVFARTALALRLLTLPYRFFAGGPLGNGRQWFTWIHIADLVGIYRLALSDSGLRGPINGVAPDIRRQKEVAAEIGRVMHRPALLPVPALALDLLLGDQSQLLLDGRRATPETVRRHGFAFRYGGLREALQETIG